MKNINQFIYWGLLLEILVLIFSYYESNGLVTSFFQAAARLSGRVSLLFFALLFIYSTVNIGFEPALLTNKYILAKDFAILHIIHWFLLATAVNLSGFELVPSRVFGGALAYLMILILPFLLKRVFLKNISLKWPMHIYLSYVWFIFFMTYVSRVTGKATNITGSLSSYWLLISATIILMIWRIFKLSLQPKRKI
ncbi:MAG: hypothetical protein V4683_18635 [Bacteroidota bacterium]